MSIRCCAMSLSSSLPLSSFSFVPFLPFLSLLPFTTSAPFIFPSPRLLSTSASFLPLPTLRSPLYNSLKRHKECLKNIILWMKTIYYSNKIKSHSVTIAPIAPFTPRSTSKLRSALHFRYSIVIPRFISRANKAQSQ